MRHHGSPLSERSTSSAFGCHEARVSAGMLASTKVESRTTPPVSWDVHETMGNGPSWNKGWEISFVGLGSKSLNRQ